MDSSTFVRVWLSSFRSRSTSRDEAGGHPPRLSSMAAKPDMAAISLREFSHKLMAAMSGLAAMELKRGGWPPASSLDVERDRNEDSQTLTNVLESIIGKLSQIKQLPQRSSSNPPLRLPLRLIHRP